MKPTLAVAGVLAFAMLFAGCKPKPVTQPQASRADSVALVSAKERSSHFAAVTSQLELDGTLYGYVDIDGDILKAVPYLRTLADTIAEEQPMAAPFLGGRSFRQGGENRSLTERGSVGRMRSSMKMKKPLASGAGVRLPDPSLVGM